MADNRDNEKWVNEVLGSTQGMHKAAPKAGLYERVMAATVGGPVAKMIPFPVKQWAAAAIILLALNIGSVVYYSRRNAPAGANPNPFAAALQMDTTYDY